jgi:hypothetical protein
VVRRLLPPTAFVFVTFAPCAHSSDLTQRLPPQGMLRSAGVPIRAAGYTGDGLTGRLWNTSCLTAAPLTHSHAQLGIPETSSRADSGTPAASRKLLSRTQVRRLHGRTLLPLPPLLHQPRLRHRRSVCETPTRVRGGYGRNCLYHAWSNGAVTLFPPPSGSFVIAGLFDGVNGGEAGSLFGPVAPGQLQTTVGDIQNPNPNPNPNPCVCVCVCVCVSLDGSQVRAAPNPLFQFRNGDDCVCLD